MTADEKKLDPSTVTIQTATINVKVVTIGKRQVTLAIFRQLQEEPMLKMEGDEWRQLGVPWGFVNYHKGVGCDNHKPDTGDYTWGWRHQHVIWQKDNELRRWCFWQSPAHMDRFMDFGFKDQKELAIPYVSYWKQCKEMLDQLFIAV